MRILPSKGGEVVGQMPDQMFADLQTYYPADQDSPYSGVEFLAWSPKASLSNYEQRVIKTLQPCLDAVIEAEERHIKLIEWTVSNGLVLPEESQRTPAWHRDSFVGLTSRFITASCLTTEIRGLEPAKPGELVRLNGLKHRSPINHTKKPILRTWVRAEVYCRPWKLRGFVS